VTGAMTSGAPPAVAFVFGGRATPYPAMTARLFLESPRYGAHLESVSSVLRPLIDASIVELLVAGDAAVCRAGLAEPALFAVQHALVRTLAELGVRPVAVLGDGVGEFAAAAAVGALDTAQAALLAAAYGELAASDPRAFCAQSSDPQASDAQPPDPRALERYAEALRKLPSSVPQAPYYSSVRGQRLSGELLGPDYWVELAGAPTRFEDALADLLVLEAPDVVVEISPRPSAVAAAVRPTGAEGPVCLPVCPSADTPAAALDELVDRIGLRRDEDDEITRIVLAAVAEVLDEPDVAVGLDLALRNDLGFDSVMLMRLKFKLEQHVPEVARFTLRDILEYLVTPRVVADFLRLQLSAATRAR